MGKLCYLFGGLCTDKFNDMKVINSESWSWENVIYQKGQQPPSKRYAQSAVHWRHFIVIYGGAGEFDIHQNRRNISKKLHLLDLKTNKWSQKECVGYSPVGRFGHGADVVGNSLVVYGGLDKQSNMLRDLFVINLETGKTYEAKV